MSLRELLDLRSGQLGQNSADGDFHLEVCASRSSRGSPLDGGTPAVNKE